MSSDAPRPAERRIVHYAGHVQGVGFRYTVRGLAERHSVAGVVENLPDGRVRLEIEDAPAKLDELLAAVADEMKRYIRKVDIEILPARGELTGFHIRR